MISVRQRTRWIVLAHPYTYTGRRFDPETGLYQYRNRSYHAQLGRYASRDPVEYEGSRCNLYEYVGAEPLDSVDPSGLEKQDLGWDWPSWSVYLDYLFNPTKMDDDLETGYYVAGGTAAGVSVVAGGVYVAGYGGVVVFGGGAAAGAGAAGGLGIGTQAWVAPGLGAGTWAGIMVNGQVYAARFHDIAWRAAGRCEPIQKYGMVIIDSTGKVIGWLGD
jgi:RHS repeat-associated protein